MTQEHAAPAAEAIRKAVVRAYDAGTHKATVQIVGSHPTLLTSVRVATNIPAANVVAGRQCTLLFLDPTNQDDAVVLTIQGALPSAPSGATVAASATVVSETAFGQAPTAGAASPYSRGDHTHGSPTDPVPAHVAAGDPHPTYETSAEAQAKVDLHAAAADPHTVYGALAQAETWAALQTFSGGISTDTISEKTAAAGVTIDGALIKDGSFKVPNIDSGIKDSAGHLVVSPDYRYLRDGNGNPVFNWGYPLLAYAFGESPNVVGADAIAPIGGRNLFNGASVCLGYFSNSPSRTGAAGDEGYFRFQLVGPNGLVDFARLKVVARDVVGGTEDGALLFQVAKAGTLATVLGIEQYGVDVTGTLAATGLLTASGHIKLGPDGEIRDTFGTVRILFGEFAPNVRVFGNFYADQWYGEQKLNRTNAYEPALSVNKGDSDAKASFQARPGDATGSAGRWILGFGPPSDTMDVFVWRLAANALTLAADGGTQPRLLIGANAAPAPSALLELQSTVGALLLTRLTTTQRDALTPVNGMLVYNSTLDKLQGYEAGAWVSLV